MKKLYLIRHAKSSWKDLFVDDFDRPLNKRGKKDAPLMGKRLKEKGIKPDLIISSPALRAKTTAQVIAKELGFKEIVYDEKIYEAEEETLYEIVKNLDSRYKTVFLVGHNPGLNMLAEKLVGLNDNIPTCGVVEIDLDARRLISFEYPKMYK